MVRIALLCGLLISYQSNVYAAQGSSGEGIEGVHPQVEKDLLIVGSEQDYPPFATGMTDNEAGGFTVELWKAVAAEAGIKYRIRVRPFREILQDFKEGRADILINLAHSKQRHQFADFTVPHVIVHGAVFVRKGELSIQNEDDLAKKSIIVLNADLAHDYALAKGWGEQLIPVDTAAEGFHLLASGKHDAVLIGKLPGMQTLEALEISDIEVLKFKAGFAQKFGFAVHEGHSELLGRINEGLAITKENGTYAELYEKWFGMYEVKEVGLQDLLMYIIPIILFFLLVGAYFFYRRHIERRAFQSKLQFITDNTPVLLAQLDQEKRYKFVNRAYAKLFGLKPIDLIGKHAREILGDESFSLASPHMDTVLSGQPVVYDLSLQAASEKMAVMSVHYSPEYDKSGLVVGFIAAITDITSRKQTEQALVDSEERFALAMKGSSDGLWDWNLKTNDVVFSKRWKSMLGYSEDELENCFDIWERLVHPNDIDGAKQAIDDYLSGKTSKYEVEFRMQHKDGHWVHILSRANGVRGNAGDGYERLVGTHVDITERKQMETNLERLANIDGLTNLYNRIYFNETLKNEVQRAIRYKTPLSLLMLDIDGFKNVNDTYGHQAGDACLIALAKLMKGLCRNVDTCARYGGEEFVIVLPQTSPENAISFAERLRQQVEAMVVQHDDQTIQYTISIGINALNPMEDNSAEELLKTVDSFLYEAKERGRNCVVAVS